MNIKKKKKNNNLIHFDIKSKTEILPFIIINDARNNNLFPVLPNGFRLLNAVIVNK